MNFIVSKKGVSLLEIIVAMSIFITAVLITTTYIIQGWTVNKFAMEQSDAIEHAKKGIISMTKEIREASFGENGHFPILEADSQNIKFYSDIDLDQMAEMVHYYLDGTNLIKSTFEPEGNPVVYNTSTGPTIISQYIRNGEEPMFYYYAGGDLSTSTPLTAPANPNEVKLIKIYLKINIDPQKAPDNYILRNYIQIRNLKDNL